MLVAAALVPDTALLVPGAGGSRDIASALRAGSLAVVAAALVGARTLVVVAPGPVTRELSGTVVGSLGAAGIPDGALAWPVPVVVAGSGVTHGPTQRPGIAAAVGLHLAAQAGWGGLTRVVEVAPDGDLLALGSELVADGPTALLVVGSGSARHGPDAPLADDERAPAYDEALLADLVGAGPAARARLAERGSDEAAALAVGGLGPWKVLVGAAGDGELSARAEHVEVLAGAQHAALLWCSISEGAATEDAA
ncbi:MAG: hypothetical protein AAGC49_00255 [Brevundimonas sp.]